MPLHVGVYTIENRRDTLVGVITLGEHGFDLESKPGNEDLLKSIMREAIHDPNTGHTLRAMHNSEEWMRALRFTYKSAYLRVTEASLNRPGTVAPGTPPPPMPTGPPPTSGGNAVKSSQTAPASPPGRRPPKPAPSPQA